MAYYIGLLILYFGCSEKFAIQALKATDWHLEGAFNVLHRQPRIEALANIKRLDELYHQYKGNLLCLDIHATHLCLQIVCLSAYHVHLFLIFKLFLMLNDD